VASGPGPAGSGGERVVADMCGAYASPGPSSRQCAPPLRQSNQGDSKQESSSFLKKRTKKL
jgi:hypothetical protein